MSDLSKRIAGLSPDKINRLVQQLSEKQRPPTDIGIEALKRDTNTFRQSFAQKRLWLIAQLDPESRAYNIPLPLRLEGRLNVSALERSLSEIVRRHEDLRTTFDALEGQPVQTVLSSFPMKLPVVDLQTFPLESREAEARRMITDEAYKLFDLKQGPLFRAGLWRLDAEEYVLLLTFHHIIFDAWSAGVLIRELSALYATFSEDRPSSLIELPIQYADYAHWQDQWLRAEVLEDQLSYWRDKLAPGSPALDLPTDRPRPLVQTSHGTKHNIAFSKSLSEAVKELSRREGVTLFMTLLAALQTLFYRYTGHKDISIGSSTANRKRAELEGLIGFFVNTLVLRVDLTGDPTFRDLLQQVREVALGAYAHQDVPFEKLVEELQPERTLSHSPLFQVAFTLQNVPAGSIELADLRVSSFDIVSRTAKYDITLSLEDAESGIRGRLEYNTDLFDAATIARLATHFERLLTGVVTNTDCHISQFSLLSEHEQKLLLVDWNQTSEPYSQQCLSQLFEAQVERTPQALAVVCDEGQLSYAELNERANRMAHYLKRCGVGAEVLVGVLMQRSVDMVVVLLAILKAGGAYVPLDPAYPKERLRLMVEDAGLKLLVTQREVRGCVTSAGGCRVVSVEDLWPELSSESAQNPPAVAGPNNLAYLIYTSGSTGRPKGVMIEHRGLVNLSTWHQREFEVGPGVRASQLAGTAFDASAWEVWPYLIAGASIHVVNDEIRANPSKLLRWLADQRIGICFMPTPMAEASLEQEMPANLAVKTLLTGGDKLHRAPQKSLPFEIVNNYGPTENTVVTTSARLTTETESVVLPPIGRPIANTEVYVLDERLQPVPIGVTAQLYIAGIGLARGYWHSPKLTAEKFIPNPFSRRGGERFYATGDLVRYLADGQLEFIGRVDQQVKIRGFRIELGEVEAALCTHAGVQQAVVMAREDGRGERRLVAYVIEAEEVSGSELRAHLKERLPDYMLPTMFVTVKEMPLTANGKVDRERLPAPEGLAEEESGEYVAPQTAIEEVLAGIWAEVLGVERVSRRDNFFDIGGHSLLMVQVHGKLRDTLEGLEVSMMDLFNYPTVESLARFLAGGDDSRASSQRDSESVATSFRRLRQSQPDIAIIGMAGRFPGAGNLAEFWDNLRAGVESISTLSDEELRASGADEALLRDPHYIKAGSFLENIEQFDASFFGFNPREAEVTDPQHRIFLECAWEVLENAGYDPQQFAGRIGLFAGAAMNSYLLNLYSNPEIMQTVGSFQAKLGNAQDFLASRVAYKLGLRGPSVVVQSACSTSLVAVHLACQSLLNGESDMALAGGVSLLALRKAGYMYQEGGIASPDGHCRPFDARAAGTVGGSGVGLVLLKRMADAEAEQDQIYALIKGSAINNDGAMKVGYTAPSVAGQAEVIAEALAVAGVGAESISYVEAHGTATPLGDPVEVAALTEAFRRQTEERGYCGLGSVKSNIGHLDAAAGVTGLIKTVLALQHEEMPASLHYEQGNPGIEFAESPFYVNAELRGWPRQAGAPRRAGVSSFGIGGTNAHVVLEEAPETRTSSAHPEQRPVNVGTEKDVSGDNSELSRRDSEERQSHLLLLSARSETTLDRATERLVAHLQANYAGQNLADVAFTLQRGRRHFEHRRIVVCSDTEDAIETLHQLDPKRVLQSVQESRERPIAFMFSGLGDHYTNMGLGLYKEEPVFRAEIDRCAEILHEHLGLDIRDLIYPADHQSEEYASANSKMRPRLDLREMIKRDRVPSDEATRRLNQTSLTQPAVFVIEYALAKLWMSCGLYPNAMIGYSLGEYVAACLAGVLSLADALALVAKRAQMIHELPAGGMLAVPLNEDDIRPFLGSGLSLAAVNGPSLCVVAGPPNAITEVEQKLAEREVICRRLQTSHAFHSEMMEPIVESFVSILKTVKLNPPDIPYVSNVTGTWITAMQATDPYYWAQHLCQAVRFADGLDELWARQDYVLLEIGAGQTLCSLAIQQASTSPTKDRVVLPTLRHTYDRQPDGAFFLSSLGMLWLAGVTIDWQGCYTNESRHRISLPTYPFDRQPYWIERRPTVGTHGVRQAATRKKPNAADWYYLPSWKRSKSLLPPPVSDAETGEGPVRQWLVFADAGGIGSLIVGKLNALGEKVVIVHPGKAFERIDDATYVLDPHEQADYETLLRQLTATGQAPERIAHLWSCKQDEEGRTGPDAFEEAQYSSFYSLLYLTQAVGACSAGDRLHLIVVSNNLHDVTGEEDLQPENATILGLCKVVPQEYPNITCLGIDLSLSPTLPTLSPNLIERFTAELVSSPSNELVAYRGHHRWEQTFEAVSLDPVSARPSRLRNEGVYLIVGGLGNIGLTLADYLARNFGARLVLTGREGLPDPATWNDWLAAHDEQDEVRSRIIKVRELEKAGAQVLVCRADVSSEEQMKAVVASAHRHFGGLNGVIYAAGIVGEKTFRSIPDTGRTESDWHFRSKAHGLYVLENVIREERLDFCMLFSSLSSVLGGLGFAAYASANIFMDVFAQRHNRTAEVPWVTCDWDTWQTAATKKQGTSAPSSLSELFMTPEEGVDAFLRILSRNATQVVVSLSDLHARIDQWLTYKSAPEAALKKAADLVTFHPRPALRNVYVAARNNTEETLVAIWQEVLGLEQVGIYDDFFQLGGHSLLGTQVISRVRKAFAVDLPVRVIFEAHTVAELAEAIICRRAEEIDSETLAQLLAELKLLPEEAEVSPATTKTEILLGQD